MTLAVRPYRSFWMGGFEGADHINGRGDALDMSLASGHVDRLDEDYANAARFGLRSVRESIGWRLAEPAPGDYDFARVRRIAAAGRRHGVQVIWTLMHYGFPAGVDLYDDAMVGRFAAFATACTREIAPLSDEPPVYNLINEINFLAWAVSATEMIHPYRRDGPHAGEPQASGYAVKRRLVRAVLAGIDAVRRVDRRARFLHIEPLLHVVAPADRPGLEADAEAEKLRSYQWQAWDLIAGLAEPELGGSLAALDLVGVNYYHSGQWEATTDERLDWARRDPRRKRFSALLCEAWARYRRPLVVAETSHVGSGRADWLHEIAAETAEAQRLGAHVDGICLYPLVDRNDWNDSRHWHRSGLWDAGSNADPAPPAAPQRLLHLAYAEALSWWQQRLAGSRPRFGNAVATLLVFSPRRWCERQRLQQWLLCLAREHGFEVLVVEEPVRCSGPPYLDSRPRAPGVEVLVPHTPLAAEGFDARQAELIAPLLIARGLPRASPARVAWLATPAAWPLARRLEPAAIVCDASDASAGWSPDGWRAAVQAGEVDLVLCPANDRGTVRPSRLLHPVGESVQMTAFDPRRLLADTEEGHAVAHLQRRIGAPRLGCFGAFDADLDLPLLCALAERRPAWNFVIVGALHGIDAQTLPRRPNVHWIGCQPYHRLGYWAAGWDALLVPLKCDADRSQCPEQMLEILATGKPVVSSRLPAVIRRYGEYLSSAEGVDAWLQACGEVLAETPAVRGSRNDALRPLLEAASWAASAGEIAARIGDLLERASAPELRGY